jgi:predicted metal-dependent HD superfamily phosphohydrolase
MAIAEANLLTTVAPFLEGQRLSAGLAEEIAQSFIERYDESWRRYHTVSHLADMCGFLLDNIDELGNPRVAFWSALGHDAIWQPQITGGDNEELSARLTEASLRGFLRAGEIGQIGANIRATAGHKADPDNPDQEIFLDSDLKILGASPAEFNSYDANIEVEYAAFVRAEQYAKKRAEALRSFYARPRIFGSDIAHDLFEIPAKANLKRRLAELENK